MNSEITKIALKLITLESKVWLSEKLDISRVTLDNRLELDNWKKPEIQMIRLLNK